MTRTIVMKNGVRKHSVVQLHPTDTTNPMFAGCMMTVTLVRPWGVQGYVQALGEDGRPGGIAHYRAKWAEVEYVGQAPWITK